MTNNIYWKKENETVEEYIMRLCGMKDTLDLTWVDIADILNSELNENFSERTYRRRYSDLMSKNMDVIDDEFNDMVEMKKERIKLQDEISQFNNLVRLQAREEQMQETAIEAAKEVAKIKFLDIPKKKHYSPKEIKTGTLAIGDWHYGADVDVYYNKYNPEICRKRVQQLALRCIDIVEKEKLTTLHVINLGDMISGNIHLPLRINNRVDVVTQTIEVSELIAEFLTFLSEFVNIEYFSVSDNHSRITPKKKESLQVEAFSRIIDWYLQERLEDNNNINFHENIFGDDICSFMLYEHNIVAVHGDKDKTNKVITNLNMFTQEHIDLIFTAHLHHFSADESNESIRLCNGSLMGSDDYSSNLRLNSKPSQLLVISTEQNVADCIYKIDILD